MQAKIYKMAQGKTRTLFYAGFFAKGKTGRQIKIAQKTDDITGRISRIGGNGKVQQKVNPVMDGRSQNPHYDKTYEFRR